MKVKRKKKRRSDHKVMTKEASLLKFLRESRNLSMRNAGAIIGGKDDTATAKKRIMRESGIIVVDSPADIGKTVNEILK